MINFNAIERTVSPSVIRIADDIELAQAYASAGINKDLEVGQVAEARLRGADRAVERAFGVAHGLLDPQQQLDQANALVKERRRCRREYAARIKALRREAAGAFEEADIEATEGALSDA